MASWVTAVMESERDHEKKTTEFEEDKEEQQRELELQQIKALACGVCPSMVVPRPPNDDADDSNEGGKAQRPFWGYHYMTPIELADDEPVTSLTIIRTFENDTGIHGVNYIGYAIGR